MAQVTGRKVATTPIVPTPSGGGNVINSWNTSDNKETNAPSIKIVKDKFDEINDNLSGFKFYPTGTGIVGLISDDSAYTDANGKYVIWGTATANELVADNPNTYKSVPSEEDCRGEVGADTATPFKKSEVRTYKIITTDTSGSNATMQITRVDENNVTSIINVKFNSSGYDDGYIKLLYEGGWKFYVYSYWMDGNTTKFTIYFAKQWAYNVNASMSFIISAKHYV